MARPATGATRAKYSHEWMLRDFNNRHGVQVSPLFKLAGFSWRLCVTLGPPNTWSGDVGVFIEPEDIRNRPPPPVLLRVIIKNWLSPTNNKVVGGTTQLPFSAAQSRVGYANVSSRMGINTASGLLRLDGTLLVRVELELTQPPAAAPSRWLLSNSQTREYPETLSTNLWGNDVGKDFLSLLTNPGATADLTIIATAAAGAAAGGETAEGGKARRGKKRKAAAAAGSSKGRRRGAAAAGAAGAAAGAAGATAGATAGASSRRFPVHRAVLAARCPYFATHFASGMADSSTSELHMPDTDPDALAALLRFVYGGELPLSSRHHARCCFELADRLLLPKAVALLGQHLVTTPTAATMAADLAWAMRLGGGSQAGPQQGGGPGGAGGSGGAGGGGSGGAGGAGGGSGGGISNNDLVTGLIEFIAEQQEEDLPEEQVRALAAEQPDLMLQLYAAARRAARRSVS